MDALRDTLRRTGGIQAVASELGLSPGTVAAAFDALLPAVVSALHLHSRAAGGGEAGCHAVVALLEREGGGALAAAVMRPGPSDPAGGDVLLDSLFGGSAARAAVARSSANEAGLEETLVGQVLPRLTMLVGGYVAARAGERGQPCPLDEILGAEGHEDELTRILAAAEQAG